MKHQGKNLIFFFLLLIQIFPLYSYNSHQQPIILTGEGNQKNPRSFENVNNFIPEYLTSPIDQGPPLCALTVNVWEIQNPVYHDYCRIERYSLMHTTKCDSLREYFEYIITPYMNLITIQNRYCIIPGYLPHSLRETINELSQFSHLKISISNFHMNIFLELS